MPPMATGRDARASGAGGASQAAPTTAERERQTLRDQLAAWKERKALEKQQQQAKKGPGPARQPTRSTAGGARSVEEKPRSSQQRREAMQSPVSVRERQPKPPLQPRTMPPRPMPSANVPSMPTRRGNTARSNGGVRSNAARQQQADEEMRRRERETMQPVGDTFNDENGDDAVKEEEPIDDFTTPTEGLTRSSGAGEAVFYEATERPTQEAQNMRDEHVEEPQQYALSPQYLSASCNVENASRGDVDAQMSSSFHEEQHAPVSVEETQHEHYEIHTDVNVESASVIIEDNAAVIESSLSTTYVETIDIAETVVQHEAVGSPERSSSTSQPKSPSPVKKQVRFSETVAVKHLPLVETTQPVQSEELFDNRAARSHPGTDEVLLDEEVLGLEQLMSEADELIHFRTEDEDHVLYEHASSNGQIYGGEVMSEAPIEESSLEHVIEHVEELNVLQRAAKHAKQEARGAPILAQRKQVPTPVRGIAMAPMSTAHHPVPQRSESHSQNLQKSSHETINTPNNGIQNFKPAAVTLRHPPQRATVAEPSMVSGESVRPVNVRKIVELSLVFIGFVFVDRFFPTSPVSRALRVAIRVVYGVSVFLGSRVATWLWLVMALPIAGSVLQFLQHRNDAWSPLANALRSLHDYHGITSAFDGHKLGLEDIKNPFLSARRVPSSNLFFTISSRVADFFLFVFQSIHHIEVMDPDTLRETESRLEDLAEVQRQLQSRVEDALKLQEEWALSQLEIMRQRRVEHAKAAETVLSRTQEAMLQVAVETKSVASEHIHDFTTQLTSQLMATIQPQLDEYERMENAELTAVAEHNAKLLRMNTEEKARVEILRVEKAKQVGDAEIEATVIDDHHALEQDKIFAEVDIGEIIESADDSIEAAGKRVIHEVEESVVSALETAVEATGTIKEAIEAGALDAQQSVILAESEVVTELAQKVYQKEKILQHDHDVARKEIEDTVDSELQKLQAERITAENLAAAAVRAEEILRLEASEAVKLLDEQLEETKRELEEELLHGTVAAESIELAELEDVEAEKFNSKEKVNQRIVDEVADVIIQAQELAVEVISDIAESESVLDELQVAAEAALEKIATEKHANVDAERGMFKSTTDKVTVEIELEIAAGVGIEPPSFVTEHASGADFAEVSSTPGSLPTSGRSSVDETELKHMMMLSVGFILLAIITALVLFPRWQLLIKNPKKARRFSDRRRRRRSWQRPAEVSDSEPEEVMLIRSPSGDDGISDANEPEPEVVEFMQGSESFGESTPPVMRSTVTTRTSTDFSSYSRSFNMRSNVREEEEESQEVDSEFQTPAPLRRALRRRSTRQ